MMKRNEFELGYRFCMHNGVCVLSSDSEEVLFGVLDDSNELLKERLEKVFWRMNGGNGKCSFKLIGKEELERFVGQKYGLSSVTSVKNRGENERSGAEVLLDSLLKDARLRGATDIHIEEKIVRFRVCGVLENVCLLNFEKSQELIRRVKALAKLNVLDTKSGQDGQFTAFEDDPLFVRVSCIPAVSGSGNGLSESVVLRLLDPERIPLNFKALGFDGKQSLLLEKFALLDKGLVLLTGPTGAGKSTTAASILKYLSELKEDGRKLVTIEDPPEYVLEGVTQIPVNKKIDFENALRLVFRQDPDVIFVGEIRDCATARIAVQASMTGHLVIATLHTGGVEESRLRLYELGIEKAELDCVLQGIVVQKLKHINGSVRLDAEVFDYSSDSRIKKLKPEKKLFAGLRRKDEIASGIY